METHEAVSSLEPLDAKWYGRFSELTFSAFEYLDGDSEHRAQQKQAFLDGLVENPDLGYPKLENFDFEGRETELLALKAEIIESEPNPVVKEIYRTRINEQLAELRMLRMAKNKNDRNFSRYSRFIHGIPDEENTAAASLILAGSVLCKEDVSLEDRSIFEHIKQEQEKTSNKEVSIDVPPAEIKGRVSSLDEVIASFESALANVGADDWEVKRANNDSITNFRVSQERQTLTVPDDKGNMLKRRLEAFIQHEVYGHVQRRVSGESSRLQLLGLGLDRVEKGEEGVATYLEQQVSGANNPIHPERYFAISLASGAVDGIPRDFRNTFFVLESYYKNTLKPGDDLNERAKNSAWNLTVRVFRGTTGRTPGAVFNKDLAYFEGNKETWALVNTDKKVVNYFSCGKFDAANPRHVGWVVSLGIVDSELKEITERLEGGEGVSRV